MSVKGAGNKNPGFLLPGPLSLSIEPHCQEQSRGLEVNWHFTPGPEPVARAASVGGGGGSLRFEVGR